MKNLPVLFSRILHLRKVGIIPVSYTHLDVYKRQDIIKRAKEIEAVNAYQSSVFDNNILEDIGYRNSSIQITDRQILENLKSVQREQNLSLIHI